MSLEIKILFELDRTKKGCPHFHGGCFPNLLFIKLHFFAFLCNNKENNRISFNQFHNLPNIGLEKFSIATVMNKGQIDRVSFELLTRMVTGWKFFFDAN
jgi:hypothetical protein